MITELQPSQVVQHFVHQQFQPWKSFATLVFSEELKACKVTFLTSHVHRLLTHPWIFNEAFQGVVVCIMVRTNAPHVLHHSHVIVQVGIIASDFAVSQHTGLFPSSKAQLQGGGILLSISWNYETKPTPDSTHCSQSHTFTAPRHSKLTLKVGSLIINQYNVPKGQSREVLESRLTTCDPHLGGSWCCSCCCDIYVDGSWVLRCWKLCKIKHDWKITDIQFWLPHLSPSPGLSEGTTLRGSWSHATKRPWLADWLSKTEAQKLGNQKAQNAKNRTNNFNQRQLCDFAPCLRGGSN